MASKVTLECSNLTCSICLNVYREPQSLPCLHTFCSGCLEIWIRKNDTDRTICCPVCMDKTTISANGGNIKSNLFLADLVVRLERRENHVSKEINVCSTEECGNVALKFCRDGCDHLCAKCLRHHNKFKLSRNHCVGDLCQITDEKDIKALYCKLHPDNKIDQYCGDCELYACDTCLLRHHRHHNLVNITEQSLLCRKQMLIFSKQAKYLNDILDTHINDTIEQEKQSSTDIETTRTKINRKIDDMIDKLNRKREHLLKSLELIDNEKEKSVIAAQEGQHNRKAAMTSLISYIEIALDHGTDYDIAQQMKVIQSRLESLCTSIMPSFTWCFNEGGGGGHEYNLKVANVSSKTEIINIENEALCDEKVTRIPLKDDEWVSGLVIIDQTIWVGKCGESVLNAYPLITPYKPQTFVIKDLDNISDIVRFPATKSQLVVSDRSKKTLIWVTMEKIDHVWTCTSQRTVNTSYRIERLSASDKQLLVCNGQVIHIVSESGEEIRTVKLQGNHFWSSTKAVAQLTSPGYVLIDDFDENGVIAIVNANGDVMKEIESRQGWFRDILCHGRSIYVTDCDGNRIDELDQNGCHIRQLISEHNFKYPGRMCVDESDKMYVVVVLEKTEVWKLDIEALPPNKLVNEESYIDGNEIHIEDDLDDNTDFIINKIQLREEVRLAGMVVIGPILWVVHCGQSSLNAYSMTSAAQEHIFPIAGLNYPINMVQFPLTESQLVISDGKAKQLLWITVEQGDNKVMVTSQRSIRVNYTPQNLGVRDTQLLVCGDDDWIHILSTVGEETNRVKLPYPNTNCYGDQYCQRKAVGRHKSSGFVVMEFNHEEIIFIRENGEAEDKHPSSTTRDFWTGDMVCSEKFIYSTDRVCHNVEQRDVNGRYIRNVLTEFQGANEPGRMCIDGNGHLYVEVIKDKCEVWMIEKTSLPTDKLFTQETKVDFTINW